MSEKQANYYFSAKQRDFANGLSSGPNQLEVFLDGEWQEYTEMRTYPSDHKSNWGDFKFLGTTGQKWNVDIRSRQ